MFSFRQSNLYQEMLLRYMRGKNLYCLKTFCVRINLHLLSLSLYRVFFYILTPHLQPLPLQVEERCKCKSCTVSTEFSETMVRNKI
ncbi:unnamed protein product [Ceutorhynchus assimilis]|uniref:Uncharacterized protein n=1 Tax=Ceutorhynchus assimilis TaxID=467358 RepID=A0A9N9MM13_9CUCU|nr:unnamed protein product [Ceutorhynchus assimilis]